MAISETETTGSITEAVSAQTTAAELITILSGINSIAPKNEIVPVQAGSNQQKLDQKWEKQKATNEVIAQQEHLATEAQLDALNAPETPEQAILRHPAELKPYHELEQFDKPPLSQIPSTLNAGKPSETGGKTTATDLKTGEVFAIDQKNVIDVKAKDAPIVTAPSVSPTSAVPQAAPATVAAGV